MAIMLNLTTTAISNGDVVPVGQAINDTHITIRDRVERSLRGLAICLETTGAYRGDCESIFKDKLYHCAKENPQEVQDIIHLPLYKENEKLKNSLEKMNYLTKNIAYRFLHHLKNSLGNTGFAGATYFVGGLTMTAIGGASQTFNGENEELANTGVASMILGCGVIMTPFVVAAIKAMGEEPI